MSIQVPDLRAELNVSLKQRTAFWNNHMPDIIGINSKVAEKDAANL